MKKKTGRRRFLGGVAATSALAIVPRRVLGGRGHLAPSDMIVLWVRDISYAGQPTAGRPALIVIQCRTGFIAAHPVDVYGNDPYSFTKDAKSSGM